MMSVTEYKYQRATHDQLMKCLLWCQNQLQLRDWEINLYTGPHPPSTFRKEENILLLCGMTMPLRDKLKADVWINTPVHKETNQNEYATVIHEALHIFLTERGEDEEQVVRILEPMLYRLYCWERGLKIFPEKK
jgi:hypothetical protein